MDLPGNLALAFDLALRPGSLLACFAGVLIGTLVGVLPGLGSGTAMALLLPATLRMSPTESIIMLSGIYYGTLYGGSTTSILLNVPGESTSMITCLDGHPMAKQGRAGVALGISAIGSFIAGTFSTLMLMLLAPLLVGVAIRFGPPEFVAITFLGLILVTYLARGALLKALMMAAVGLLLGCVGLDIMTGEERFTLGLPKFMDGIGLMPVMIGLFGISEVLCALEEPFREREVFKTALRDLLPTRQDIKDSALPIGRGTVVGFFLGLIPGGGGLIASLFSYAIEKGISRHPERFGAGAIEGVAGPETANNAGGGGSLVPLLTLGIPCNVLMAVLLGALMLHGVAPGPLLMKEHPELFWGVVGSLYVGNVLLLILNLPLIGVWVQLLRVPYAILFPLVLLFTIVGSYSLNNEFGDALIAIGAGVFGYLMRKFEYEPAPLIMALILGPMFEDSLRQSLVLSSGGIGIFFTRPLAAVFMGAAMLLLASPGILWLCGKKRPGLSDY